MRKVWVHFAILLTASALRAQQPPSESARSLTGSAAFGWLNSTAREFFEERRNNPFTSLKLDFQSWLFAPDVLTFRFQPRLSTGFQDAFTGISEGSGLAFETTFLPRRPWPLRFRYSRSRRSTLTSGLGSSYSRFMSKNNDSLIGIQWQYVVPKMPSIELSFDKASTATAPEAVLTQGFESRSRTFALNVRDTRKGWIMNGGVSLQKLDTQYVLGFDRSSLLVENQSRISNTTLMAQRPLPKDLTFYLTANRSVNRSQFDRGRFDQTFESLSGKLEYRPEGKFQAWSQARVTGSDLETRPGAVLGGTLFLPPSVRITNRMLDTEARYQVHPSLALFGRNEFTQVRTPESEGSNQRAGNFMNTGGGAQFFRSRKGLVLAGSYYLYTTFTEFERLTSGRLLGHAVDGSVSAGDASLLRATVGVSLNRSSEEIRSILPFTSRSERIRVALARSLLHRWTVEAQGAVTNLRYTREEVRSNFLGRDYGVSLAGPNYYLSYHRSVGAGDTLQRLLGVPAVVTADILQPLIQVIGASNSTTTLNASWNLTRQFSIRAVWRGQAQTVGTLLASRFEEQEALLNWQFRKVRVEAGYVVYRFNFGTAILRRSILFRLTRDFRLF